MKKIILIILPFMLFSCTKIHFDKVSNPQNSYNKVEKWHHNAIYNLLEVSPPINLEKECRGRGWNSVKTELSLLNALSGALINSVLGGFPIWNPKTATITCS
jgi:hypothetical protein